MARLQKNVICITFGQPLFSIPYVQEMVQIYPAFEQTLHLVLDKEDIVPPILCYFGIGCVLKSHTLAKTASKQVKSTASSCDPERLKTVRFHVGWYYTLHIAFSFVCRIFEEHSVLYCCLPWLLSRILYTKR